MERDALEDQAAFLLRAEAEFESDKFAVGPDVLALTAETAKLLEKLLGEDGEIGKLKSRLARLKAASSGTSGGPLPAAFCLLLGHDKIVLSGDNVQERFMAVKVRVSWGLGNQG